ncbi:MAG TPA: peptide ABC transporter substrate-binding protein [Verrucomicrobiae bacterium]|nr:peptide ABC transporter substrate-binding protein [Verrucomicrobiae bacterium]
MRLAGFLCLLLAGLPLVGCHREPRADITIINGNEPESLDPAIVTGSSEMRITKALFEGLVRLEGTHGRPVPALADHWEISSDRKVYTFHMRKGIVWSTGEPITSADVVYSWFRALDPATAADYAGQLFYIKNAEAYYLGKIKDRRHVGISAPDAATVRVELEEPIAFFLDLCCFPTLEVVPRQAIERAGDRWLSVRPLPCSGPYVLEAWRPNDKVRLRKNPRYWNAANTQNEIVDVLPIGSPNTALNLYETGVADVVWDKDLIPAELLDVLMTRPDFHTYDYLGTFFYRFNVTRKPFDDVRVRQAFALATDRQRIVKKLTKGGEKPAYHLVPDGVADYQSPQGLGYDPARARELLAAAGFPDGKGFPRVQYAFYAGAGGAGRMQEKLGVELREMWLKNLGVDVGLRQIERKIFYSVQSHLDFDLSCSSWLGDYDDANTFLDLFTSNSGNNRTGWKSSRYDDLLRQANLQTNVEKRAALMEQAEDLLVSKDAPIVPVYFYTGFNYFNPNKIAGIHQNLLDEHPLQEIRRIHGS